MSEKIDTRKRGSLFSGSLELKDSVIVYEDRWNTSRIDWASVEKASLNKEKFNRFLLYGLFLLPTGAVAGVGFYMLSGMIREFSKKLPSASFGLGLSSIFDSLIQASQLMSAGVGSILLLAGVYYLVTGILRRGHKLTLVTQSGNMVFQMPNEEAGRKFLDFYEQKKSQNDKSSSDPASDGAETQTGG